MRSARRRLLRPTSSVARNAVQRAAPAYRFRSSGLQPSRRLALPRDDLPPEFFEKYPVTAGAKVVSRRLRAPDVVKLCVGMAAVQQLVQICQHRAEVIV